MLGEHVRAVDHIAIAVVDLEQSIYWYTGALGFKLLDRRTTRGENTSMISAVLQSGTAVVVLVQGIEPNSQVSRFIEKFGTGVQHFAFAVDDLEAALRGIMNAGGIPDTPIMEEVGIRQVFLRRDPATGVRIELIERNGGDFSDASVKRLFRAFESNGLY